jgi:hypothetical protein
MTISETEPTAVPAAPPRRRRRGLRITVLGLLILVAVVAVGLMVYRRQVLARARAERPTLVAVYARRAPVADGVIGPNEYGPGMTITWAEGNTLAAFQHERYSEDGSRSWMDPTKNKAAADLSLTVYTAYTDKSLFFAFRVHDQFVDAQEADAATPHQNDGVEVFLDGDGVPNDFGHGLMGGKSIAYGSKEGFQLLVDAAGHALTTADFTNAAWKRAVRRLPDGYIVEMEIPLALIDTKDGRGFAAPGPGAKLNFALAATDNDAEVRKQVNYAYLKTPRSNEPPWLGREPAWNCAVELERPWFVSPW